ncbi:hypothetical protein [Rhizobium leguminosarum]|uniref:hypothetical protein n=1 Tax=Rhizobium leguminosarum TaxID=384 RepID=UPI001441D9F4|nr:hypothetical protein [Rhizobium leguminosarum]MBY5867811.1 hypothetical protein [Rhizobium leguminosarum]NKM06448.1 hypothetical protein [Rhizobium leguminosarum bv. viciae]
MRHSLPWQIEEVARYLKEASKAHATDDSIPVSIAPAVYDSRDVDGAAGSGLSCSIKIDIFAQPSREEDAAINESNCPEIANAPPNCSAGT